MAFLPRVVELIRLGWILLSSLLFILLSKSMPLPACVGLGKCVHLILLEDRSKVVGVTPSAQPGSVSPAKGSGRT